MHRSLNMYFTAVPLRNQVLLKELMILLIAVIETNKVLMSLDGARGLEHKKHFVQIF